MYVNYLVRQNGCPPRGHRHPQRYHSEKFSHDLTALVNRAKDTSLQCECTTGTVCRRHLPSRNAEYRPPSMPMGGDSEVVVAYRISTCDLPCPTERGAPQSSEVGLWAW